MRKDKGVTLIEVLVVVSILGVLMGLVSVLIMRAGSHQRRNQTEQIVRTYLPNMIERYMAEFKSTPPMNMKELNAANRRWKSISLGDNTTNECIEVLVVALRHPDFTARLEPGDVPGGNESFGNTDEDTFNTVPDGSTNEEAVEVLDGYGNPLVYIHKNAYGTTVIIVNHLGEEVEVQALKRADGSWYNPTKFQIISVGENGVQDLDDPTLDYMNFEAE